MTMKNKTFLSPIQRLWNEIQPPVLESTHKQEKASRPRNFIKKELTKTRIKVKNKKETSWCLKTSQAYKPCILNEPFPENRAPV